MAQQVLSPETRAKIEVVTDDSTLSDVQKRDQIYTILVEAAGLVGKAFFGHRKTRADAKQLARLWKLTQKFVPILTKQASA